MLRLEGNILDNRLGIKSSTGVSGVILATVFSIGAFSFGNKLRLLDCLDKANPVSRDGVLPIAAVRGSFLFFTKLRLPTLRDSELERDTLGEGSKLRLARPFDKANPVSRDGVLPIAAVRGLFTLGRRSRLPSPRLNEFERDERPDDDSEKNPGAANDVERNLATDTPTNDRI